jgi:putative ABC transport system permease protein
VLERTTGKMHLWPATLYGSLKRLIEAELIEESNERPAPEFDDARRRYYRLGCRVRSPAGIGRRHSSEADYGDRMNFARRIYRRLAEAFPHEFKLVYGTELRLLGEDVMEEMARRHGVIGLIRLIVDIAFRLPIEYLDEMRRDLRYAVRALIKSPGFALVGIVSLGIGMGMTTSVFSRVWAQMFRGLPAVTDAARLAIPEGPVSYYYIEQYRTQKSLFESVAAFQTGVPFSVTLPGTGHAKPERVFGQIVSAGYFSVLGVKAQRGRVFSPEIDKPGDAPVVVITDRFWRNRLNSAPDALGQALRLNGQPATIIGITPKEFRGAMPVVPAEIFVPVTVSASLAPELANDVLDDPRAKIFQAMLRLAPGVTIESAEAGLDAVTRRLDDRDSSDAKHNDMSRRVTLLAGGTMLPIPRAMRPVLVGFFVVLIGLILTISCMNLANMLLARGSARRKELAIRLAVGASRFRLIRHDERRHFDRDARRRGGTGAGLLVIPAEFATQAPAGCPARTRL